MARLSNTRLRKRGLRGCRVAKTEAPSILAVARDAGDRATANRARRVMGA